MSIEDSKGDKNIFGKLLNKVAPVKKAEAVDEVEVLTDEEYQRRQAEWLTLDNDFLFHPL